MKCNKCGAANDNNAKYCRECGATLQHRSVMEVYPDLHLQPTSMFRLSGNRKMWLAIIPLSMLFLLGLYSACVLIFYVVFVHEDLFFAGVVVGGCGIIASVVSFILIKNAIKKTKSVDISKSAEYIESTPKNSRYSFIVKNGCFGLYDTKSYKVQIDCKYKYLVWTADTSVLRAIDKNGEKLIDIYDNILN